MRGHLQEILTVDEKPTKGVRFTVYRPAHGWKRIIEAFGPGAVGNNPTDRVEYVTALGEGVTGDDVPSEEAPAFRLVKRIVFGEPLWHAQPDDDRPYEAGSNWLVLENGSKSQLPPDFPRYQAIRAFDKSGGFRF
jgi:hypothetical protein